MFNGVRARLTALYLLVSILLITLIGGGAYLLLRHYFLGADDLALQYKMAYEFREYGMPLPPGLSAADAYWRNHSSVKPLTTLGAPDTAVDTDPDVGSRERDEWEEDYNGALAAIFVLPLDRRGAVIAGPDNPRPLIVPNKQAIASALQNGYDLRTIGSGESATRLLTYRINVPNGPAVLQLGRTLNDQEHALRRLVLGLVALGTVMSGLMGVGSWWLAGKSLTPVQESWMRQRTFVANASHELRAPLALLRTSAEVARRHTSGEDADQRELLDDVLNECDHLTRLVKDLFLLSRLDTNGLTLKREAIELHSLLEDVKSRVAKVAEQRGIALSANGQGAVWGDLARLQQVLIIILDNALRHTQAGGDVRISSHQRGRQVSVVVADTGTGITPTDLPHIFERFYRSSSTRSGDDNGSGLGLSIAKALIEAQYGAIHVESKDGRGTRVSITLPSASV